MVKTKMEKENQTKIDEYDNKEIVEKEAEERTKTSQIKKLKYIGKLVNDMINELEPKTEPKSDESVHKDKSIFGMDFGSKDRENKMSFGFKSPEKKLSFGSGDTEKKSSFGFKSPEKKLNLGSKHTENKLNFGSKLGSGSTEKKMDFGIKTIPVTSKKSQLPWQKKSDAA